MLNEVARRLGWGHAFDYTRPADIFREHAALSGFENDGRRIFDIGPLAMLSDAEYDRLAPVQWPVSSLKDGGTPRLRSFATEDGRARIVPTLFRPVAQPVSEAFPLVLNTGRVRDQWHTMTRTGRVPRLMTHRAEPLLDMHPADASRLGLAEGDLLEIASLHGAAVLPVRLSDEQRPGEVFAPMHWTDGFSSTGPIDRLVGAATDPISGQPELKATAVRATPVPTQWCGLLLRRTDYRPATPCYWARIPLDQGHGFELRGLQPLPSGPTSEAWITELLGGPEGAETIVYADPRRGIYRYASLVENRLDAWLFLAPTPAALPARDTLSYLMGSEIEPESRVGLLSSNRDATSGEAAAGRAVCACFAVGLQTVHRAIVEQRLTSVAEIGAALRAGTNCGSCIPELSAILREIHDQTVPATA
jgi:assimilatory nitrate reductase catalytic subunit